MKESNISNKILNMLLEYMDEIPSVLNLNCSVDTSDSGRDPVIHVKTGDDSYRLIMGVRKNGQPRHARDAVAQLLMKSGQSRGNTYPIFAAPFISESAAEICRQVGAGYIDLAGNCRIVFDGIYIEHQGRPNRFVTKRSLRSLYQSRSSRVLRALLFDPKLQWKLTDLSIAAGVSIGQVFNVKKALIDREWAVFEKDGLRLTQPGKVIHDWSVQYAYRKNLFFDYYISNTPQEIESELAQYFSGKGLRYAFTSFSAYARLVPKAEHTRVFAYIDTDDDSYLEQTADDLKFKSVISGPNVTLLLPHDEGVFFGTQEVEDITIVSPIQAYLDIKEAGNEGAEASEELFSEIIQKAW